MACRKLIIDGKKIQTQGDLLDSYWIETLPTIVNELSLNKNKCICNIDPFKLAKMIRFSTMEVWPLNGDRYQFFSNKLGSHSVTRSTLPITFPTLIPTPPSYNHVP